MSIRGDQYKHKSILSDGEMGSGVLAPLTLLALHSLQAPKE